jgi:hypothetical protein
LFLLCSLWDKHGTSFFYVCSLLKRKTANNNSGC